MDNWEATIQAAATRLGVTLKVKQLETMVFISASETSLVPKGINFDFVGEAQTTIIFFLFTLFVPWLTSFLHKRHCPHTALAIIVIVNKNLTNCYWKGNGKDGNGTTMSLPDIMLHTNKHLCTIHCALHRAEQRSLLRSFRSNWKAWENCYTYLPSCFCWVRIFKVGVCTSPSSLNAYRTFGSSLNESYTYTWPDSPFSQGEGLATR